MKIVHIANFYGPNSGGIKTTLHQLGRGYLRLGHDFTYIVPGSHFFTEKTMYGTKITLPGLLLPGSGGYRIIKSNKQVRDVLESIAPDRLEISDRFTLMSLGAWARKRSIPTVVFSHETLSGLAKRFLPLPASIRNTIVDWHNRKLSAAFDYVVTTTDFAAREFHRIEATNLVKIPLGVDLHAFHPRFRDESLRQKLLKGSSLLLVHCGRFSPEKEPQRSIETLIELRNRGVDARLVMIGAGPMWKKLRALAAGHPVDILGYVADRQRVAAILAASDVSLAPGPLETFCLAALESLASGTPVVASESSAVGEFLHVNEKNPAGAVARDDAQSFAYAVQYVVDSQLKRSAARKAAEELPWDDSINLMRNLHGLNSLGENAPHAVVKRKLSAA